MNEQMIWLQKVAKFLADLLEGEAVAPGTREELERFIVPEGEGFKPSPFGFALLRRWQEYESITQGLSPLLLDAVVEVSKGGIIAIEAAAGEQLIKRGLLQWDPVKRMYKVGRDGVVMLTALRDITNVAAVTSPPAIADEPQPELPGSSGIGLSAEKELRDVDGAVDMEETGDV